jgi:signal peptidase I
MFGKNKAEKKKETWDETIRSFLFAVLIALVFRSVAYEPFHIPSGSMLSTLYEGDYIFVSKYSYGYSRFSFPLSLPLFKGRVLEHTPERGDVVVFRLPTNTHIDFIKRVVGLPGDKVQMKHDRLYINGQLVEQTRRGEAVVPSIGGGDIKPVPLFEEVLPGGKHHIVLDQDQSGPLDNTPEFTVPEGHYFMMGDNRDDSADSRYRGPDGKFLVGFVPLENIVGRAELVLLSYDTAVPFWKLWQWPHAFRGERWFNRIN